MKLTLYNSLTREKQVFKPMNPKRVTMYNCGPTVYSYAHIGNARAAVVADVLFRVLRHIYGEDHVQYARNLTDVDDKIIAAAQDLGVPMSELTEKFARIYNEDLAALNCLPPTYQPKATDNINEMADIIVELLDKEIAYISEGHVLFDVTKMKDYGKLSGRKLDDNLAGARVEVASYKRNAGDFVLWKPAKEGEPDWNPSNRFPPGRPGWHLECSAMIKRTLGDTIDIHCGGIDLKFPHHENEIAQSCCALDLLAEDGPKDEFGDPIYLAKFWVHNEFLNMASRDGKSDKMSKSLGNVVLVHDLLKDWDGEVIRLALLKAHYRSELIWSEGLLKESKSQLDSWYGFVRDRLKLIGENYIYNPNLLSAGLFKSLQDDVNTPDFLSRLVDFFKSGEADSELLKNFVDAGRPPPGMSDVLSMMINTANLLGLLQKTPEEWFRAGLDYDGLVAEYDTVREQALSAKQSGDKSQMGKLFKRSDELRDQFKAEGIVIESCPNGKSTWRKI